MAAEATPAGERDLLRLTTAGSVDDGKSTLIGRLLADSGALHVDQLVGLAADAYRGRQQAVDFSRITDGLTAEREQGITIDVAYRYFATDRRNFILADVPGHEQYTRNMVTGASKASAALFLLDARSGMTRQTRRHICIAALLGLKEVVFAVNKMDLVDYEEGAFVKVRDEADRYCAGLPFATVAFVPVSAKIGDQVVRGTEAMPWYEGPPLVAVLENLPASASAGGGPMRLPVQMACRPGPEGPRDFRGYMGRIASGRLRVGDGVIVAPDGFETTVTGILAASTPVAEAVAGQSVTVTLADAVDVGRGHVLAAAAHPPRAANEIRAVLCWLDQASQDPRRAYEIRSGTRRVAARISPPRYRLDVETLDRVPDSAPLSVNEIGETEIRLRESIAFDSFSENPATGAFIVIDSATNDTVAAGMIEHGL